MSSFYGGKEGRSFIIAKTFTSIAEMEELFKGGSSYTDVHFDEYALINTVNKNDESNGKVFRRGYDYGNDRGGAIYVGTIVGPAGRAPNFNLDYYNNIESSSQTAVLNSFEKGLEILTVTQALNFLKENFMSGRVPYDKNGNVIIESGKPIGESSYIKFILLNNQICYFYFDTTLNIETFDYIGWRLIDAPPKTIKKQYTIDNGHLIPGVEYEKNDDGSLKYNEDEEGKKHLIPLNYHDSIDWISCSIRDENSEDSTAYIGFKFGVPVVEFEAETVDAYYNRSDIINDENNITNNFNNLNLIKRSETLEDGTSLLEHPNYFKWDLKIPKGIKGDSIKNLRVISVADANNVVEFVLDENGKLQYGDKGEIITKKYSSVENSSDLLLVYDYYYYDRYSEGESLTIFLGLYNMIERVYIDEDSHLKIKYIQKEQTQDLGTIDTDVLVAYTMDDEKLEEKKSALSVGGVLFITDKKENAIGNNIKRLLLKKMSPLSGEITYESLKLGVEAKDVLFEHTKYQGFNEVKYSNLKDALLNSILYTNKKYWETPVGLQTMFIEGRWKDVITVLNPFNSTQTLSLQSLFTLYANYIKELQTKNQELEEEIIYLQDNIANLQTRDQELTNFIDTLMENIDKLEKRISALEQ